MSQEFKCNYCNYCNKDFFLVKEHTSYSHKGLMDVYRSNFYRDVYSRIKKLENLLEEKDKIILEFEDRLSKLENYK
jgi:hypothetical protein